MTRYISLAEYLRLAEQLTGVDAAVLAKAARVELEPRQASQAGFGGHEFYPDLADKAAVLVCRLAWNHPLPDGNKRTAWAALVLFLDLNEVRWSPDPPNIDSAEAAMVAIAARDVDEVWTADWLRARTDLQVPLRTSS